MVAVAEDFGREDTIDVRTGGVSGFGEGDSDRVGKSWWRGDDAFAGARGAASKIFVGIFFLRTFGYVRGLLVGEAKDFKRGQAQLAVAGDGEGLEEVEVLEWVIGVEGDVFVSNGRGRVQRLAR